MKRIVALVGMLMATQAIASDITLLQSSDSPGTFTDYHYRMRLDIVRVVSHDDIPPVCGLVPVEMTYEDSQGNQHTIHYRVMGSGC